MKSYLIDPFAQSVTVVDYTGNYKNIYEHIKATCFTTVQINPQQDMIFVDDEGLFKKDQAFFRFHGYDQPLAGRGLVLGTDRRGESVEPKCTIEWLSRVISWEPNVRFAGMAPTKIEEGVDHPYLGKVVHITRRALFEEKGSAKDKA